MSFDSRQFHRVVFVSVNDIKRPHTNRKTGKCVLLYSRSVRGPIWAAERFEPVCFTSGECSGTHYSLERYKVTMAPCNMLGVPLVRCISACSSATVLCQEYLVFQVFFKPSLSQCDLGSATLLADCRTLNQSCWCTHWLPINNKSWFYVFVGLWAESKWNKYAISYACWGMSPT